MYRYILLTGLTEIALLTVLPTVRQMKRDKSGIVVHSRSASMRSGLCLAGRHQAGDHFTYPRIVLQVWLWEDLQHSLVCSLHARHTCH